MQDIDIIETNEWLASIDSLVKQEGPERAQFIIDQVLQRAKDLHVQLEESSTTPYINTIPVEEEPAYPGDLTLEERIKSVIRWNSIMIVLRASDKHLELGGHIATYQGDADIYEVGFNHFFQAKDANHAGDLVFFQGHSSPGMYGRAFTEGRLSQVQVDNFRQEVDGNGLSSYPHPRLMPDFWQFPTVSMGLGAVSAIYHAKFLKYLDNRGLKKLGNRKIYSLLGDGEMDEIESRGAISIAGKLGLDNLIFILSCNFQRLDGPVEPNHKSIQEFEQFFKGSNWNVIKLLWGSAWDKLFQKDTTGKLMQLIMETKDGDFQDLASKDGAYMRKNFFGKYPETAALVADMNDTELSKLYRGGHDSVKIYAALKKAHDTANGKPTVILASTVKGFGLGTEVEARNTAHQAKKLTLDTLYHVRTRLDLNLTDKEIANFPYITLEKDSEEYKYLHARRNELGGFLPKREETYSTVMPVPALDNFSKLFEAQARPISTTMSFVRALNILLKDKVWGQHIVPIVPDEARTFGMEGLFRQIGIYDPLGAEFTPEDKSQVAFYKTDTKGQLLEEGINELGATAMWLAAGTSYSTNDLPMIPFFVYYSMFGFQRVGDMLWSAGDQRVRGFLIGGTSGRTTLNGEGLQHEDGHSQLLSSTFPSCISYDPAFSFEVPVIIQDGIRRMYGDAPEDIFYYITTLNETYEQPAMPEGAEEGIRKGMYKFETLGTNEIQLQLLGSGAIFRYVREAAKILADEYNISSAVFSTPSFTEIAREARSVTRWNRLHPTSEKRKTYLSTILADVPTIAATDYVKAYPEQIAPFMPTTRYTVLGTDGFGRSDSRENLRRHYEVDAPHIVIAALYELAVCGDISMDTVAEAIQKYNIDTESMDPLYA